MQNQHSRHSIKGRHHRAENIGVLLHSLTVAYMACLCDYTKVRYWCQKSQEIRTHQMLILAVTSSYSHDSFLQLYLHWLASYLNSDVPSTAIRTVLTQYSLIW
ncbi:hypothetical protein GDO78_018772 [Eleutherodactylus coqui]|uniref:Uncharacterized protein n=1 Tax=Eleutherodactylus coqui TaxID=57060 RepID=A0A8J6B9Q8_ELECQ|nr:hypothetical protein GDO78_018772 [Eleutherodactylus coqui]